MRSEHRRITAAATTAAANLHVDDSTAEVLRAFNAEGVRSVLLKGPSTVRWLYGADEPRAYGDCDLLVHPFDVALAERVLSEIGYKPELAERKMPGWWRMHAVGWLANGRAVVDLHRTVPGVGADDVALWSVFTRETETLVVGGTIAAVPSVPTRALHVALHAAQHGPEWLDDLDRAVHQLDEADWRAAAELASELDASDAFTAGLRLVSAGKALAERLGLTADSSVEVTLSATGAPAEATTFERIVRASTLRQRVEMVGYKLIPPPTFMRKWSPLARHGVVGLGFAYGFRWLWVLGKLGPAFWAWRRTVSTLKRQSRQP